MNETQINQGAAKGKGYLSPTTLQSSYSNMTSLWGAVAGAQQTLLAFYIAAHSFLIAAFVVLIVSFCRTPSLVVYLAVLLISAVGLFLALQMALAWGRIVARGSLIEWHLRRIEKNDNYHGPEVFTDWERIKDIPGENLVDPDDGKNEFYANWAVRHHKKWWAKRARMIPIILAILYLFFLFFFFFVSAGSPAEGKFHGPAATVSDLRT